MNDWDVILEADFKPDDQFAVVRDVETIKSNLIGLDNFLHAHGLLVSVLSNGGQRVCQAGAYIFAVSVSDGRAEMNIYARAYLASFPTKYRTKFPSDQSMSMRIAIWEEFDNPVHEHARIVIVPPDRRVSEAHLL